MKASLLLQSVKNTRWFTLNPLSGAARFSGDPAQVLDRGVDHGPDVFTVALDGAEVTAIRGNAAAALRPEVLELRRGFAWDRSLLGPAHGWRPASLTLDAASPLLADRALRLQIERAVACGATRVRAWGDAGQRTLTGALAELSTTVTLGALAGATLDAEARDTLGSAYLAWQRAASAGQEVAPLVGRSAAVGELLGRIEDRAPRWLRRPHVRARAVTLALLREAIQHGARRKRKTAPSAHDSDLLRMASEPRGITLGVESTAETLLGLLERTQRAVQHQSTALAQRLADEPQLVDALLEEQDWVFGDQGDITYETLRPLQQLRGLLCAAANEAPLHLALLVPTARPLAVGGRKLTRGAPLLVGAPVPRDAVEERLAEPLALALWSLLLQHLELLEAPRDVFCFRRRDR